MNLVTNWRAVLTRAWSVRFFALAIIIQGIDVALPWFRNSLPISDEWFGILTLVFCVAGVVARFIQQRGVTQCP